MRKNEISLEESVRQVSDAMRNLGEVTAEAARVFWDAFANGNLNFTLKFKGSAPPGKSNNWLKMHGYPMRRKGGRSHAKGK